MGNTKLERGINKAEMIWVSRDGYQKLLQRQKELMAVIGRKKLELGRVAAEDKDLPENLIFKELRVELMFVLPRQLRETNHLIEISKIIEDSEEYNNADVSKVFIGSKVTMDFADGDVDVFSILGPTEVDVNKGIISYESPLGRTILGKTIGEVIEFETPTGRQSVKVLSIEKHQDNINDVTNGLSAGSSAERAPIL